MGIILNAELIKSTLNIPAAVSNQSIENLADATVDIMNSLGADIPNMAGNSGAKTLSLDSRQMGKFWPGIRATYNSLKDLTSKSVGDISFQPQDLLSNDVVMRHPSATLVGLQRKSNSASTNSTSHLTFSCFSFFLKHFFPIDLRLIA